MIDLLFEQPLYYEKLEDRIFKTCPGDKSISRAYLEYLITFYVTKCPLQSWGAVWKYYQK